MPKKSKSLIGVLKPAMAIALAFTLIDYSAHFILETFGIIENVLIVLPYYYWGKFIATTAFFVILPYLSFLKNLGINTKLWILTGLLQLRYLGSLTPTSNLVIILLHYFTLLFVFRWNWFKKIAGVHVYG